MSNLILGILVPGYEDYEPIEIRAGACCYPPMWPAELQAEIGVAIEREKRERCIWNLRPYRRPVEHPERLPRVLAQLADESGWKEMTPPSEDMPPKYRISQHPIPRDQRKPRKQEGIRIDRQLLRNIMGDIVDKYELTDVKPLPSRYKGSLQDYVLVRLAERGGWQMNDPCDDYTKRIYKIR